MSRAVGPGLASQIFAVRSRVQRTGRCPLRTTAANRLAALRLHVLCRLGAGSKGREATGIRGHRREPATRRLGKGNSTFRLRKVPHWEVL